jgi:iron complex outermembrane receptor protein
VNYIAQDFIDPSLDATERFDHLTPKVSVSYQTGRHTLYGAIGGGLETPAFNEIDPPPPYDTLVALNPFLDPMVSVTYEAGAKGDWGIPRDLGELEYDIALYWIDVEDDLVPFDGGVYFETAGRTRRRGLETGLRWIARPWFTLTGALTLEEDRYVEYKTSVPGAGDVDYAGNQVAGLPAARFQGAAEFAAANGLSARLGLQSVDGYWADDANTLRVDPFTTLSARMGYERRLGRFRARIFGGLDNLADATYTESVYINPTLQPDPADIRFLEPGLPRNWSAGFDLRFE